MKDRNGNEVRLGDRAVCLTEFNLGKVGYVCRVRSGDAMLKDSPPGEEMKHWGSWCKPDELSVIPAGEGAGR